MVLELLVVLLVVVFAVVEVLFCVELLLLVDVYVPLVSPEEDSCKRFPTIDSPVEKISVK